MMYHINKEGIPSICSKNGDNCKLGSLNTHFETIEEAQKELDKIMNEEFNFLPDVKFANAYKIPEHIVNILSNNYSELYVIARYLENWEVIPVVCLGKDIDKLTVCHCLYEYQDSFYDVNGLIAANVNELEKVIKDKYKIINDWVYVETPESIYTISEIVDFDIDDENALNQFKQYMKNKIIKLKDANIKNKYKVNIETIEFMLKDLK